LEISHWGVLQVEEHYEMRHAGAKLKGTFSRLDYQRAANQAPSSFNHLVAKLPKQASDIYYRDRIGNISTSTCRLSKNGKNLEFDIQPRFPLFGGWKTEFYIGYNVPIQDVLSNSGSRFKLDALFGTPFDETVIDSYVLKVILPEGASDIAANLPFDVEQSREITKTYLDTTGRTVLVFKKKNVLDEHNLLFQVEYNFSPLQHWVKPACVIAFLLMFCVALMTYSRLDLTISKGPKREEMEKQVRIHEISEEYVELQLARNNLYYKLESSVDDKNAFDQTFTSVDHERTKIFDKIKLLSDELKELKADSTKSKIFEIEGDEGKNEM